MNTMKATKPKRCLHMRFQETGKGDVSTRLPKYMSRFQYICSSQFNLRPGRVPVIPWIPLLPRVVRELLVVAAPHVVCHLSMAGSLPPPYYTSWQQWPVFLGSWDRVPGIQPQEQVLGTVGGCLCTQQHHGPSCPLQPSDSQDLHPGNHHLHPSPKYFY